MLALYEPELGDLRFRQKMLADEKTMSYNRAWGGTISWPEEQWAPWYDHWIANPEGKRFYRYLKDEGGRFIGEIAYHYDASIRQIMANVIIYSSYRGKGYGGQALDLLCEAAKNNGVRVLYDNIALDNPAMKLFLDHGFEEEFRTDEAVYLRKALD